MARKAKEPPPLKVTVSFAPPRPDDGERFVKLVQWMLRLGRQTERQ
jgi:hypothetical protein